MRFLLILILVYFAFKIFWRYVFPFLLTLFIKKAAEKMQGGRVYTYTNVKPRPEGEVSIDQGNSGKKKPSRMDEGEYVDFEEVK